MYGTLPKGMVMGFKGIVHEIVGHHACTWTQHTGVITFFAFLCCSNSASISRQFPKLFLNFHFHLIQDLTLNRIRHND